MSPRTGFLQLLVTAPVRVWTKKECKSEQRIKNEKHSGSCAHRRDPPIRFEQRGLSLGRKKKKIKRVFGRGLHDQIVALRR